MNRVTVTVNDVFVVSADWIRIVSVWKPGDRPFGFTETNSCDKVVPFAGETESQPLEPGVAVKKTGRIVELTASTCGAGSGPPAV